MPIFSDGNDGNSASKSLSSILADSGQSKLQSEAAQEELLKRQINVHQQQINQQSVLSNLVGKLYDGDDQSFKALKDISKELASAEIAHDQAAYKRAIAKVEPAVKRDQDTLFTNDTITGVTDGALKTAGMFALLKSSGGARYATGAAVFGIFGVGQAKANQDLASQSVDFALGGGKGLAMSFTLAKLSKTEINPVGQGLAMGLTNRFLDSSLSRETYHNDNTGKFDLSHGVEQTFSNTFASKAMIADAVLFGVSSKIAGGLDRTVGSKISAEPLYKMVSTSSVFGLSTGAYAEYSRQQNTGEKLDIGKIATRSLLQATVDAAVVTPFAIKPTRVVESETPPKSIPEKPMPEKPALEKPLPPEKATQSVSDLLKSTPAKEFGDHPVADYTRAMENYPFDAQSLMHVGRDAVSINLASGNVLKLTARDLPAEFGTRSFDVPIIGRGKTDVDGVQINHFIQPKGEPVTDIQHNTFLKDLARENYWMSDPGKRNLVFLPGENKVALVDPWAVEKLPSANVVKDAAMAKDAPEIMSARAEELKPLNASSKNEESLGRQISNFAETPFMLGNRRYLSLESFYQSLKFADPKVRAAVAKMSGKQAKEAGSKAHTDIGYFDRETFELGSARHHEIIRDAMRQKFLQNPDLARDFVASSPRPIEHNLGRPEDPRTRFPAQTFTKMLEEMRDELGKMDLSSLGRKKKK
ncbi:MAG: hypothetical protein C0464_02705 [Cyanobacteria bacterium DS2.008]|nr:hypothetical protein [Cyanobacteria bacterium DS2.008]